MLKQIKNKSGFSIIETVLVFIGLAFIIYFVVDSSSTMNNARIRAFMDEINGYKKGLIDFQLIKGRWPGDFNNDTYFSWCGGVGCPSVLSPGVYTNNSENYTSYAFPKPYDALPPNSFVAPFIDLYFHTKGNSFKPNEKLYDRLVVGETVPYVESLRNLYWYFYTFGDFKKPKNTVFSFLSNVPENTIWFGSDSVNGLNIKRYLKTFKILDQKMDDGNYLDGNIRSYCSEKGCSKLFIMLTNNS